MNQLPQRKLTRHESDPNLNAPLLCNARTGSLLANRASWVCLREWNFGVRDIGERDFWEKDIAETVATCRFPE
jgi:hypothetical protein